MTTLNQCFKDDQLKASQTSALKVIYTEGYKVIELFW